MKVLIVHGWGANSQSNWFPWLKNQLDQRGITTYCPDLPNPDFPKKQEWLAEIRKIIPKFKDEFVLVGHSLGCTTILHLMEQFEDKERVGAVILVSSPISNLGITELKNFFNHEFNFKKIRASAGKFFVIHSNNDPVVPLEQGKELAKLLGTELIVEKGLDHINLGDGYFKYERLLKIILQEIDQKKD